MNFGRMYVQAQPTANPSESPAMLTVKTSNFKRHFQEFGREGSILIYDSNNKRTYEYNSQRNATTVPPASTFKIFNSLVALETGVIRDDVAVLTWDGIVREIDAWNRDTNLRQAFKDSTVWFYQVLARRIGYEKMQQFINKVGYGNRQIGTTADIDRFWLQGPLQITPQQQIKFLQQLYQSDLPFSQRSINLVKDIMIREQTPDYTLRGKTGWLTISKPNIGWFVGYLEQNKNVYYFATTLDMYKPEDAPARIEITRRSLKDLGLMTN
ncbi:beta-lactamase [Nostoc linckia z18]|uniref:beta-lactamase n=3 Tax=Nostoc linckia TaxID=92942 RepID=A0A9Q5ZD79_NOSLI|nr:class D beta-lactamase [Nostoc linckia]PHJ87855.1 beta-lactamase [Nostoc linckia z6]PHK38895.1 beta-lactamase [Nostoc linckia z15]PHK44690.1 beta-lactamase [Nostoc linckia z16]PHJ63558.1 beta-lactamase [Nostoc linckia z1]PHJ68534.1 beta-lactamase [Nostoc linckia z3]